MRAANTTVRNKTGLHARPASDFVGAAKGYTAKITIRDSAEDHSTAVNAKSIVMLLAQGFEQGADVTITADGPDEDLAVAALIELIDSGFGEDE
jgi:phosphocarrier protein